LHPGFDKNGDGALPFGPVSGRLSRWYDYALNFQWAERVIKSSLALSDLVPEMDEAIGFARLEDSGKSKEE
jgi:hypothetical protein